MKIYLPTLRLIVVAGLALAITSCRKPGPPADTDRSEVIAVHVAPIEEKQQSIVEEVVGSVRAVSSATIEAKVAGRISQMLVDLGQHVTKDQLLAVIDAQEVKAQYDRAVANRDQAARDYRRFTDLMAKQVTSRQEFDAAENRYRVAEAAVQEAQTMLGYIEVRAPFDGVITSRISDVGDFASPGKPLLLIENPQKLRFEADVPETIIDQVRAGEHVRVSITALNIEAPGIVSEVSPSADPTSRTYLTRIDLPQTPGIRAGQFGRAFFPVGNYLSVSVPARALIHRGQMELIFVVDQGRARLRLVKSGKAYGDEIELLSGASKGDLVITNEAGQVVDGQRVQTIP